MPGAEVAILGAEVSIDRTVVSDSDGAFVFKNLKPGEYQVTARMQGFDISPLKKVELAAGKIASVDVPLGPSLAASPLNRNSGGRSSTATAPYRVETASLRLTPAQPESNEPASAASAPATEAKPTTTSSSITS